MASLEEQLMLYREGRLSDGELTDVLHELGHSHLLNRPTVQSELVSFLSHPDPILRYNALGAIAYHGLLLDKSTEFGIGLLGAIDIMLHLDEDQDCRRQAASALGTLFKGSRDREVISALAKVCQAEAEAAAVKAFAYAAIFAVAGVPIQQQPNPVGMDVGPVQIEQMRALIATLRE